MTFILVVRKEPTCIMGRDACSAQIDNFVESSNTQWLRQRTMINWTDIRFVCVCVCAFFFVKDFLLAVIFLLFLPLHCFFFSPLFFSYMFTTFLFHLLRFPYFPSIQIFSFSVLSIPFNLSLWSFSSSFFSSTCLSFFFFFFTFFYTVLSDLSFTFFFIFDLFFSFSLSQI